MNINKVFNREAERKAEVIPLPTLRRKKSPIPPTPPPDRVYINGVRQVAEQVKTQKEMLLEELDIRWSELNKERDKMSTRLGYQVNDVYEKLKQSEGQSVADEFMAGNIPMPELRDAYSRIQATSDAMNVLYDKIQHVKKFGVLPDEAPEQTTSDSDNAAALKYEIRRLDDLIYKTNKKLSNNNGGIKKPKNTDRVVEWKNTVAMSELRRDELKRALKELK